MALHAWPGLDEFLDILCLAEKPLGLYFTDQEPKDGFHPDPLPLPTREKENRQEINWQDIFGGFSCSLGHIWRARRKKKAAWFSAQHFGCPGAAFWLGFLKPQTNFIATYVSSGFPHGAPGELYLASPEECMAVFEQADPPPAPAAYLAIKPLDLFEEDETPLLVSFFARPESMCGLHQLATFVTGDPEVVRSPFSAACGSLLAWPLHYQARGQEVAVLGGWDPSARKFFPRDELSLTVPFGMFQAMLAKWQGSFLTTKTWALVRRKAGIPPGR